jgi:F-type H+-transporting ATPase subunit c
MAAASALNGIARNPAASGKLFVPMILGLALVESLVIYALVISLQIMGKVGT